MLKSEHMDCLRMKEKFEELKITYGKLLKWEKEFKAKHSTCSVSTNSGSLNDPALLGKYRALSQEVKILRQEVAHFKYLRTLAMDFSGTPKELSTSEENYIQLMKEHKSKQEPAVLLLNDQNKKTLNIKEIASSTFMCGSAHRA